MIKLIEFLIYGCWHRWVPAKHDRLFDPKNNDGGRPIGYRFFYTCEKCGRMKKQDLT